MKLIKALTALLVSSSLHADSNNGLVAWYPLTGHLTNQKNPQQVASVLDGAMLRPDSVAMAAAVSCGSWDRKCAGVVRLPAPFSQPNSIFTASIHVLESGLTDTAGGAYLSAGHGENNVMLINHHWENRSEHPEGCYYGRITGMPELLGPIDATEIRNRWVHYVVVSSIHDVSLYKDGVKLGVIESPGVAVAGDWYVGKSWWYTGSGSLVYSSRVLGNYKNIRIYSRALSDQEVANLYALESAPDPCIPHAATAEVTVVNGFVVGATITGGGCGYLEAPVVMIHGSGTGATAVATMSNGIVTGITITNAGSGYGDDTQILIASPPFMPSLEIAFSKVMVTLHVVLGKRYVLESSADLTNWTPIGAAFTAEAELREQEFSIAETGRFFRIQEVP
jgi:hypothetical protein